MGGVIRIVPVVTCARGYSVINGTVRICFAYSNIVCVHEWHESVEDHIYIEIVVIDLYKHMTTYQI